MHATLAYVINGCTLYARACCVIIATVAEHAIQFMTQENIGRFLAFIVCCSFMTLDVVILGVRCWSAGDFLSCQVPYGRQRS